MSDEAFDPGPPSLNPHAHMSVAEIVATYSSPALRRSTLTPAGYRDRRIGNGSWRPEDEEAWQRDQTQPGGA